MAFDPDAYLSEGQFNPDAYLGAQKPEISQDIISQYPEPQKPWFSTGDLELIARGQNPASLIQYEIDVAENQKMRELAETNPEQANVISEMSGMDKFLTGVGAGFSDIQRGASRLDKAITPSWWPVPAIPEPAAPTGIKELEQVSQSAGAGRVIGQAAPFLPAALATGGLPTLLQRTAGGAAVGASEGGLIASGTDKDVTTGALVGAGIGGSAEIVGTVASRTLGPLVKKWFGSGAKALDEAGNPTPELQYAAQKEGISLDDILRSSDTPDDAADQVARNARRQQVFEDFGLTPTEAQRTRDKDLFQMQQDAYKRGGAVTERIEGQEQQLSKIASKAVSETGGSAVDAPRTPINAVLNKATKLDERVSDLYRQARESAPTDKSIKFNSASSVLRQYAQEDQLTGGLVSALRGYMEKQGMLTGMKPTGRVSVESAENVRKYANQLFQSTNDRGKQILRDFKDAVDADTGAAIGQDWFKQARDAKRAFETGLDKEKLHKFDERAVSLVRDILNNKVTADDIDKGVLFRQGSKYKAQDLVDLKRYLDSGDVDDVSAGQQAWADIRAQAMQSIKDKAFGGPTTELGTRQLSRAQLEKSIKDIGREKFNVLFNPKEQKFLFDLVELSRYREPPSGTAMGSGPSGEAIERLGQRIESKIELIFGVNVPIISQIKGNMTEKKLLKLNDDLAELERLRIIDELKAYRQIPSAAASVAIPSLMQEETP